MDPKKLIEEVLIDLANNKSLTDVSTKIQIIVRLLGNDELKQWFEREFITGYTDSKDLPDYRISQAVDIKANYLVPQGFGVWQIKGQSVPVANLGIEKYKDIMKIRFEDTISAIIEFSKHPQDIAVTLNPYEKTLVQKVLGDAQIQSVHKVLSPATFQTIIDNVQSKIIDLFLELDEKVFNGQIDLTSKPVKEEIHQVITNNFTAGIIQTGAGTIEASNSTIAAKVDNLSDEVISKLSSLTDEIDRIVKDEDEEHNEIAQEIVDIRAELSELKPKKNLLKKSFKAIAWTASVSCKTAIESLVKRALDLL